MDLSVVVIDFCLFLLASPTAGVVILPIGCVTLLSQPIQISNELSQKSARMGAVVRAMGNHLTVLTRLVRWRGRRSGVVSWSIASGGREEGGTDADFRAHPPAAAGVGDGQACHRRHPGGQAADEEGVIEE